MDERSMGMRGDLFMRVGQWWHWVLVGVGWLLMASSPSYGASQVLTFATSPGQPASFSFSDGLLSLEQAGLTDQSGRPITAWNDLSLGLREFQGRCLAPYVALNNEKRLQYFLSFRLVNTSSSPVELNSLSVDYFSASKVGRVQGWSRAISLTCRLEGTHASCSRGVNCVVPGNIVRPLTLTYEFGTAFPGFDGSLAPGESIRVLLTVAGYQAAFAKDGESVTDNEKCQTYSALSRLAVDYKVLRHAAGRSGKGAVQGSGGGVAYGAEDAQRRPVGLIVLLSLGVAVLLGVSFWIFYCGGRR